MKSILHIDMNNFFASVECLLNPSLKNYAVAVAGNPEKRCGVVLAKNYLAKVYGVKTGDVIWEAKKKCPSLIVVAPHFNEYERISLASHKIYEKYTDLIEPFGMDECWLDVTNSLKLFNCTAEELAKKIQDDVFNTLGLSVSIGVSFGKTLAKLGSDMKKPKGLVVIDQINHIATLKKLNVDDMIMIGKHTSKKLHDMNVNTLYDLYQLPAPFLQAHFGIIGQYLHNSVSGIDDDIILPPREEDTKSIGNGATSPRDMTTLEEIKNFLHDLATKVSQRLRFHKFKAQTIHLSIKFADFSYLAAQHRKNYAFSNEQDIFQFSYELFCELTNKKFAPVRALRICTTNLTRSESETQVNLFTNQKNESLCSTIDTLKDKYGNNIISLAKDYKSF